MDTELLTVELEHLTITIKGKKPDVKLQLFNEDVHMRFKVSEEAKVNYYCSQDNALHTHWGEAIQPLFVENGMYQIIAIPTNGNSCSFDHEYDAFRQAVSKVANTDILMGNLHFKNEIGLTDLVFLLNGEPYVTITIEVFPKKLDYKKDYLALIEEVNEEIYNLAYSFIKRTYLTASRKQYKDPTLSEFYRILEQHVEDYMKAIEQVERFPHHQLITTHELVRGEKLRKLDSAGRNYLRKNASVFVEVPNGINFTGKAVLPTKGLLTKKIQTYDTHENRYVKWSMKRVVSRLSRLSDKLQKLAKNNEAVENESAVEPANKTLQHVNEWKQKLTKYLNKPFWREIGELDRSVYSLVMQMGIGYREVFKIYTILSQSLVLHGEFYKMSLKDVATLYEYWSFLKVGQILSQKCDLISQDIIQVKNDGLYVNLSTEHSATRIFSHPQTGEKIELKYQYHSGNHSQTVDQRPDTMLSISKAGKAYAFQYILDAKYRVNLDGDIGPMNADINVMHRYRDAIVGEQMNIYERLTFGAYVLFPWGDDERYRNHSLFLSINKVNIGGLPFLPNNTKFVEELIDNLLNKSGEQLQKDGILPKGTVTYMNELEGDVLVVQAEKVLKEVKVSQEHNEKVGNVKYVAFASEKELFALSEVLSSQPSIDELLLTLSEPIPLTVQLEDYAIAEPFKIPRCNLQYANTISEAVLPKNLLRILKRLTNVSIVNLDSMNLSQATNVGNVQIGETIFELIEGSLHVREKSVSLHAPEDQLFKFIVEQINNTSKEMA